jgi:nitroreductase
MRRHPTDGRCAMEVLEAIQKRRTVRVPFKEESVADELIKSLMDVSDISPSGDPVSWRIVRVDDEKKPELARIVKEDFGDHFQKDGRRFKQVFSKYPRWLRFSEAKDGIRLAGLPNIAGYFFRVALGARFGPLFGKLGIMNAEIRSYCRNIVANPALFGVFLDRRVSSTTIAPIVNAGSMLQNLRLAATSLGLCYQDLGWITATRTASEKARVLLGLPDNYAAINFFRIGHADDLRRQDKKSDFRRDLKEIVHVEKFGRRDFQELPAGKTDIPVLEAISGSSAKRDPRPVSGEDVSYVLEAARWAPTGFNVQPFEFLVNDGEDGRSVIVLEDRDRRDPDPGPCEALARGGVLQNIRIAARAVGLPLKIKMTAASDDDVLRNAHLVPRDFSIVAHVQIGRNTCRP